MKKTTKPKTKKPLERHKIVVENLGKGKTLGQSILAAGYSEAYSKNPHQLKGTESWDTLVKIVLSDDKLIRIHDSLLNSHRLDHMTFPPEVQQKKKGAEIISDEDIENLFLELGCRLRKIVHGDLARHVYFWSPDNQARDKALEKAYKIKNKFAPEEYNLKFKGFSKNQLIDTILSKITKKK